MATSSSSVVISTRRSMVSSFLTLGLALFLVLSTLHGASGADWQNLETASLPKGISDHTATRVGDIVYLAGGCDAVDGNKWDEEIKQFLCASISSSFFGFDIVNETLVSPGLPDMPVPRYRHAAAAAGNKIWLVGGRDVDDNPVEQVDVRLLFCLIQWNVFFLTNVPLSLTLTLSLSVSKLDRNRCTTLPPTLGRL